MSTPLQMAKAECANYESDGSCHGVGMRYPKCMLADGKRCQYFEECVLPLPEPIGEQISIVEIGGERHIKRKPLPHDRLMEWKDGQRTYKAMAINS